MRKPWDYLIEADADRRAKERAWRQDPEDAASFTAYLADIARGAPGTVELSEVPQSAVRSKTVRQLVSEMPLSHFTHNGHNLRNLVTGAAMLLTRRNLLMSEQDIRNTQRLSRVRARRVRIEVIAYNPSSLQERFIVIASGSRRAMGINMLTYPQPIIYIGSWNDRFWTHESATEHLNQYYQSIGTMAALQRHGMRTDAIIIYSDPDSSFARGLLADHIRAGI